MILKVLNDRILVKPEKTQNSDPELPCKGTVTAVGNGVATNAGRLSLTIKPGDIVYYGKYAPIPTQSDLGVQLHVIREDDVLMYYSEDGKPEKECE